MTYNPSDRSVKFGRIVDGGYGPNKAFPFVYTFVPKDRDLWDTVKATAPVLTNNLSSLGVTVAAGVTVQHSILLDQNYNFKMLSIKFGCLYANAVSSTYEWYDNETGWRLDYADPQPVGTPLYRFLRVSLSLPQDSKYLYGDRDPAPLFANAAALNPLSLSSVQANESGIGQVRIPYLLPQSGQVLFQITNTHSTKALVVYGGLFGMKVRM